MKKFALTLLLICSSQIQAFPAYTVVNCKGVINNLRATMEYNRETQLLAMNVKGMQGAMYAQESNNRIRSNAEFGNPLVAEIVSNSLNWEAVFNLYADGELLVTGPLSCQKIID